ncbi:hypothetical protein [Ornithobacterium rhinotracheale]|uniref:hypothetical protein n=1 Tax=Ornithobacterium rhinotracheale TaxID=28251 RepID=UPI00129C1A0C|nr:hypothetical protein [Ornithobacterium rhinotracheale]MRI64440.1 hypothetical protein [Ornithobacterium rhinotracheale]MRJ09436.1 hypothetical protein [Ornithobacterium rhinotracheale]UOH77329.1 hypothetical protein MT996_08925 [Ornithobacterium rhinotracheale]
MKKVTISLTPEQLNAVLSALENMSPIMVNTPAKMAVKSIFDELLNKLLKKQVEKRNDPPNKNFKMKLKYYEAYSLSVVLTSCRSLLPHGYFYEKNVILRIGMQIDKQLQP